MPKAMSELRTEIGESHRLVLDLPASVVPGQYAVRVDQAKSGSVTVILTQVTDIPAEEDPLLAVLPLAQMNEQQRRAYLLTQQLDIRLGSDFKFDREEANQR